MIYGGLFVRLRSASQEEIEHAAISNSIADLADGQLVTKLAIARAEAVNMAAEAYVASCGKELAEREWREAGVAEERYQLLTSFIAFSPASLSHYMPADFEIVLWEDLSEARVPDWGSVSAPRKKVGLLAGGKVIDY